MFVTNVWELLILRFLLGLFVGGLLPSLNTLIRKNAPEGKVSTAYGFYQSAVSLGNMLGPVTYGILSGPIGIPSTFLLTGVLLLLNALWLKHGFKDKTSLSKKGLMKSSA
jgi:DHA1 family multidrug resistance protein-like MFS transporter